MGGVSIMNSFGKIRTGTYRQNVGVKSIQIDQGVDTGVAESLHAPVVVSLSINMIDTDRVGAKLLHEGSIALALLSVDQGVGRGELVGNSWVIISSSFNMIGGARIEKLPLRKN